MARQRASGDTRGSTPHGEASYRERLTVPWWAWPAALGAAALGAAELAIGSTTLRHPLTFGVACAAAAVGLIAVGRIRIEVDPGAGELRVDDARLPLGVIASVEPLDLAARRDLLGPDTDPVAFVIQRPWVPGGVRIDLADPGDPTPYWFVSTRHPDRFAAALVRRPSPGSD